MTYVHVLCNLMKYLLVAYNLILKIIVTRIIHVGETENVHITQRPNVHILLFRFTTRWTKILLTCATA